MSKAIEMDEVFTPEEVAQSLKVAGGTIRNLIRKKELFAYQVGDQYRIPRFAIEQWLSPFKGIDWESIGFGMWKKDKATRSPEKYVRALRQGDSDRLPDYLKNLEARSAR